MLKTKQEQIDFCREFNISEEKLRSSRLTWDELEQIANDFEPKRNEHRNTVKQYAEAIHKCSGVHSLNVYQMESCQYVRLRLGQN